MYQELIPAHWFRYELWGFIRAHTSPFFSVFWFPSSNVCIREAGLWSTGQTDMLCYTDRSRMDHEITKFAYPNRDLGENELTQSKVRDLSTFYSSEAYMAQINRIWDWNLPEEAKSKFWGFFVQLYCVPVFLLSRKESQRCLMQHQARSCTPTRAIICIFNYICIST